MKDKYEKKVTSDDRGPSETSRKAHKGMSFVMTLWLEPGAVEAKPEWRWRVIHAKTGEQVYFRRVADVLAYVSEKAGVSSPC